MADTGIMRGLLPLWNLLRVIIPEINKNYEQLHLCFWIETMSLPEHMESKGKFVPVLN
jgi:hypothetical protein